jgi:hypothetical protein
VNHKAFEVDFAGSFASADFAFLADMQTRAGRDTATVRLVELGGDRVALKIEDEQSKDAETWHVAEEVGYVGLETGLIQGDLNVADLLIS